jgi:hypothetical protein
VGGLGHRVVRGVIAGAVGTLALDATTYLDMAVRGRPASSTPEQTVEAIAALLRLPLPDDPQKRQARLTGVGTVLGTSAGVSAGVVLSLLRPPGARGGTAAATGVGLVLGMLVGNGPMTILRVTAPRTWSASDWASDVAPHLAYAVAAAGTLEVLG